MMMHVVTNDERVDPPKYLATHRCPLFKQPLASTSNFYPFYPLFLPSICTPYLYHLLAPTLL